MIVAQEFCIHLENNPNLKTEFIRSNLDNFQWLTSRYSETILSNFWTYGPPIPNANGLILHVCSVYCYDGIWRYSFNGNNNVETDYNTAKEIKEMIENKVRDFYADSA